MVRSFIAVDIEDKPIVARIIEIEKQLITTGALLKIVEPQNLHITIRFLGEISEKEIAMITRAIKDSVNGEKSFTIKIEELGAFPSISRPRVIWLGVSEGKEKLMRLASKINLTIDKLGYRMDKEFKPHLTIARVKRYNSSLVNLLDNMHNVTIGLIKVKEVRLKKSKLTPSGPIYTTLASFTLEENN